MRRPEMKSLHKIPFVRIVALLCAICAAYGQEASAAAPPAMLPLELGNQWQYETADGRYQFTIAVGIEEIHNGIPYRSVRGYGYGTKSSKVLVRQLEDGQLNTIDDATGQDTIMTMFAHVPGAAFNSRMGPCDVLGRVDANRVPWQFGSTSTAAAVRIRYESIDCPLIVKEEIYAENLGLVQRIMDTAIGRLEFRLVYARVGRLTYRNGASSVLSLNLDRSHIARAEGERQAPVRIRMQYALEPLNAQELRFRSGQHFDFFLVDSNGNEVWRYSDQEGYIQPIMTVPFHGLLEFEGYLPAHRFPDGSYMLYGWLNTDSERQPTVGIPFLISSVQPAGLSKRTPSSHGRHPKPTH